MDKPYIIDLPEIHGKLGKYSVIEDPTLPFAVKRIYWIFDSAAGITGGNHAHLNADRILICVKGKAEIQLESSDGTRDEFILDHATKGLYLPRLYWMTYQLYDDAILMIMSNTLFKDDVKLADYANFKLQKY